MANMRSAFNKGNSRYYEDTSNNSPKGKSKQEEDVGKILTSLGIKYEREYRIGDNDYRYDFFLPNHNCLIEVDGQQHFEINSRFHGKNQDETAKQKFQNQKRRDDEKNQLARRSGYKLIRIDHEKNLETSEHIIRSVLKLRYDKSKLPSTIKYSDNILYSCSVKYNRMLKSEQGCIIL